MALYSRSDCHPARARTVFTLRCDRCRAELDGERPGYATDAAMRATAARQGWARVAVVRQSDGQRAHRDVCPACQAQAGHGRQRVSGRATAARTSRSPRVPPG